MEVIVCYVCASAVRLFQQVLAIFIALCVRLDPWT